MKTIIRQFRISYIHGTTFLDFNPDNALDTYHNLFVLAKRAPKDDLSGGPRYWRLPWQENLKGHQKFWERYIDVPLDNLDSKKAFKFLVPFRIRLARISADWLKPGSAYIYGYWYVHRVVVVICINAKTDEGYTLDELIEHAVKIRTTGFYTVTWLDDNTKSQFMLKKLAFEALNRLVSLTRKDKQPQEDDKEPFTIATVIKGDFDSNEFGKDIINNGPIHRVLFAMSTGQKVINLPDDDCQRRRIKKLGSDALSGDILYGRYRARAGWFPQSFNRPDKSTPLGCYHNNLTFASMQTDSLLAAVRLANKKLEQKQPIGSLDLIAKPAAGFLGSLHGPNPKKMYQSYSVREQINDEREAVNNVRYNLLPGAKLLSDD